MFDMMKKDWQKSSKVIEDLKILELGSTHIFTSFLALALALKEG